MSEENAEQPSMRVGGIVLCGGESRRMGKPKAWLPFGEELMLQRIVRILREVVQPIVVVAAPEQTVPPIPEGIEIVRDDEKGRGPLQGLAAGLQALQGRADAVYVSSCDVPFLQVAFIQKVISSLGEKAIAVPNVGGYFHPLAAVYRIEVLGTIRELLTADRLRPVFLFDAVPTQIITEDAFADVDPTLQSLRNLNTPEDYETALRELQGIH